MLALGFIGILVSLMVQGIKTYWDPDSFMVHLILAITALAGAGVYMWISQNDALLQSFIQVCTVALAFHNILLRKLEE